MGKIKREFLIISFCIIASLFITSLPAFANQDSCSLVMANSWRDKFPFDIIVGTTSSTNYFNTCPTFTIFGERFEACSVRTIADLVKNLFIVRIAISALISL
jgi:hypothetical protein